MNPHRSPGPVETTEPYDPYEPPVTPPRANPERLRDDSFCPVFGSEEERATWDQFAAAAAAGIARSIADKTRFDAAHIAEQAALVADELFRRRQRRWIE